jgi:tetratricopeptide (TPR) repeat protein
LAAAVAVCAGSAAVARPLDPPTLADAQRLFYNARYEETAALTLALRVSDPNSVAIVELRSSALLFQLKGLLEDRPKNEHALKTCATCPALVADFLAEFKRGQDLARAALAANPRDDEALFFLGKLDLNYVWLQLGPLQRKTGWDEYWEARASLDEVLRRNPRHIRARVARAWIAYIVDTRMPWGTRWLLGGGDRKQALIDVQEAAQMEADVFTHAEAEFALWDMRVRERDMTRATEVARRLALDFPDNREVAVFLDAREASVRR